MPAVALGSARARYAGRRPERPRRSTATAHVDADLFFPLFAQRPDAGASPRSRPRSIPTRTIEVAMMLDITGSMAGQKIKDLKTAADDALDAFLAGQDPDEAARARRHRAVRRRGQHRQPCQHRLCRDQVHDVGAACARRSAGRVARRRRPTTARPSARATSNSPMPARTPPWSTATIGWASAPRRR